MFCSRGADTVRKARSYELHGDFGIIASCSFAARTVALRASYPGPIV